MKDTSEIPRFSRQIGDLPRGIFGRLGVLERGAVDGVSERDQSNNTCRN
jgi:hypothetical protein